jgi:GDP-fucose protein O-fucosyltransferase
LESQFNNGFVGPPPVVVVRYRRSVVLCAIILNVSHLRRIQRLVGLSNDARQGRDHHLTGELPPLPEEGTMANLRKNNKGLDWAKIHQVQMQNLHKMGQNRHNAIDVNVVQTTTQEKSANKKTPSNKTSKEKLATTTTSTTLKASTMENTRQENLPHQVAGLDCTKYGGPSNDVAREMVYWRNIPDDANYASPFAALNTPENPKYLTFEPDEGGWNNIRMAMETAVTLAHATGRILVMPPQQGIYLLDKEKQAADKNIFTFDDFFHFDSIEREHAAVEIISFEDFLKREAMTGHLYNKTSGLVSFPHMNRTNWDGPQRSRGHQLWPYMRSVATNPIWAFDDCVVGLPDTIGTEGALRMVQHFHQTQDKMAVRKRINSYTDNPTPVNAAPFKRLRELLGHRPNICVYGEEMQNARVFHVMGDNDSGARLLVHFVSIVFCLLFCCWSFTLGSSSTAAHTHFSRFLC